MSATAHRNGRGPPPQGKGRPPRRCERPRGGGDCRPPPSGCAASRRPAARIAHGLAAAAAASVGGWTWQRGRAAAAALDARPPPPPHPPTGGQPARPPTPSHASKRFTPNAPPSTPANAATHTPRGAVGHTHPDERARRGEPPVRRPPLQTGGDRVGLESGRRPRRGRIGYKRGWIRGWVRLVATPPAADGAAAGRPQAVWGGEGGDNRADGFAASASMQQEPPVRPHTGGGVDAISATTRNSRRARRRCHSWQPTGEEQEWNTSPPPPRERASRTGAFALPVPRQRRRHSCVNAAAPVPPSGPPCDGQLAQPPRSRLLRARHTYVLGGADTERKGERLVSPDRRQRYARGQQ